MLRRKQWILAFYRWTWGKEKRNQGTGYGTKRKQKCAGEQTERWYSPLSFVEVSRRRCFMSSFQFQIIQFRSIYTLTRRTRFLELKKKECKCEQYPDYILFPFCYELYVIIFALYVRSYVFP